MDHVGHLLGEGLSALVVEPEARLLEIGGDRDHALRVGLVATEEAPHRRGQAGRRLVVVARTDERVHRALRALQEARQDLHPDEAGRAGDQHGAEVVMLLQTVSSAGVAGRFGRY